MLAPSLYGESFGIVLLEAFACGTPVVGFGNKGYRNIVGNTPYETFFPSPENLDGFTNKIDDLIVSEGKRTELEQLGLELAKKYDWRLLTEEIEQLYVG